MSEAQLLFTVYTHFYREHYYLIHIRSASNRPKQNGKCRSLFKLHKVFLQSGLDTLRFIYGYNPPITMHIMYL